MVIDGGGSFAPPAGAYDRIWLNGSQIKMTQIFHVNAGASLNLKGGLVVGDGRSIPSFDGGGIYNDGTLTIDKSSIVGHVARDSGGAIFNTEGATLTVTDSLFAASQAHTGGAVLNEGAMTVSGKTFETNSVTGSGGAIDNRGGTATISSSLFSQNVSTEAGGAIVNSDGGNLTIIESTFTINNSTANNLPLNFGGAIRNNQGATAAITASTIAANTSSAGGGISNAGDLTIQGSIIANNASAAATNCEGNVTSLGSNLSNDATCGLTAAGDTQNSPNIGLNSLLPNGGPTWTMKLNPDSPAVDAADCARSSAQDQRGVDRPKGGSCDIGAFELQPPVVQTPIVTPSPSSEGQEVIAAAAFAILELDFSGTGLAVTCTVDYGDGSGPLAGTVDAGNTTCTGPAHTYADDHPPGTPSDPASVVVAVTETATGSGTGSNTFVHTINNIPPTINGITTNSPVPEGQPAQIQVTATDPGGAGDPLTYRFDCDNNGSYETAGAGNTGQCSIDGPTTISVQVADDDTGVVTQTVEVTGGPSGPLPMPTNPNPPPPTGPQPPGNGFFQRTWERTNKPVADGITARTWMWAPQAFTAVIMEPYAESPGQVREVQYFDKARMEITDPNADPNSIWYVTNGLLVVELITGQMQVGNAAFEARSPAQVNVAGDADDLNGPTYATFSGLIDAAPRAAGKLIAQRVDRSGNVIDDPQLAGQSVSVGFVDDVTNHGIAVPFWDFMNSSGPVLENGQIVSAQLFGNAFFATGRPITEAYWATVKVAGTERDILIQCFERRCLTFTPGNPVGFVVEAGNVGQHYFNWRYVG